MSERSLKLRSTARLAMPLLVLYMRGGAVVAVSVEVDVIGAQRDPAMGGLDGRRRSVSCIVGIESSKEPDNAGLCHICQQRE
jgi:hypothetical protein